MRLAAAVVLLVLGGCVDAETAAFCEAAPVVTWDNFGSGFLTENCQPCHASSSPTRNEAPEDVTFDSQEQVDELRDRILARATGESPGMPPEGGVSLDDRQLAEVWLRCWE